MQDVSPESRRPRWQHLQKWTVYQPMRPVSRRLVILISALWLILDSLIRSTSNEPPSVFRAATGTAIVLCFALIAWRPPIAAVALIVTCTVAAIAGDAGSSGLLGVIVVLGAIALTTTVRLTIVCAIPAAAWLVAEVVKPQSTTGPLPAAVIAFLGVISVAVGLAAKRQAERSRALADELVARDHEVAEQLRHERDLIADELHDIVAHEITIVALHAAVLERTEDPQTRAQSQTAIREAAVQALTDIRRVLGMVRGEENLAPERIPSADSLPETINAVTKELGRAGITVTADVPVDVRLPSAPHVALMRVIRESSTNVLKHATGAKNVRISLVVERGWARLEFADDSPPSRTAGLPASGYGIMRLQERFRLFGGSFSAEQQPRGWVVSASLPLDS